MRKRDPPHKIEIHLEQSSTKQTVTVKHGHCSCIAGKQGSCNHCFAALYLISHCTMCGLNSVPEFSCMMVPQKWHMPRSIMKPEPVMQSARLNPLKGRSGKRETAVTCTLYEARRNQASVRQQTMGMVRQRLIKINPQIPFVHLLEFTASKNIETQLGAFPEGSVCSYLLANMEPGYEVVGSFEVSN